MIRRVLIGALLTVAVISLAAASWLWRSTSSRSTAGPRPVSAANDAPPLPVSELDASPAPGPPKRKRATKAVEAEAAGSPAKQPPVPFRPGESLEYTAHVSKLTDVASIRLAVAQRQNFFGRPVWHLQAFAHTQNALRMVFALDDQFDSYSDVTNFTSFQYELHLNERGEKVDRVLRMTSKKEPAPADATAARVLPGTRDPLGMIEYLRTIDWKKTPEVSSPVFDGQKLYDVRARLLDSSVSISVPGGVFTASRIEVHVFQNGAELKDTQFALSLANAPARTPVLLEAEIPFATVRVELLKAP